MQRNPSYSQYNCRFIYTSTLTATCIVLFPVNCYPVTPGYVRWRQTWDLWTLVFLLRGEKLLGGRTGATSWTRPRSGRVRHKKKKKKLQI